MTTRRDFLRAATLGMGTLASVTDLLVADGAEIQSGPTTYAVFTKHFLGLSHDRLADTLAELGVTAIEAPIRPGGHVEPQRVVDELPRFVEVLKSAESQSASSPRVSTRSTRSSIRNKCFARRGRWRFLGSAWTGIAMI